MSSTVLLDETTNGEVACDPDSASCLTAPERRTTTAPPEVSAGCGYNCSRHIYAKIRTRQWYEDLTMEQREVIKTTYYQSYDYMTGLRTAASLGGTIMLFSLFILYKMKCRHGKHRTKNIVLDGATALGDIDIEKDGGYLQNGNSGPMGEKQPSSVAMTANNVGSRRSSRVVLTPEDFQFLTRQDHRRLSVATSSRSEGSRRSCGAIPPYRMVTGDRLPSSYSIASQHPMSSQQPRFTTDPDDRFLGPDLAVEPINIHIIQPTPNVSPCGSVRRLSEDVVALKGCRSKEFSSVSIPLLAIPRPQQAKAKGKSKRSSFSKRDRAPRAPMASTSSASTCGDSRHGSEDSSDMRYIDCSDSDAVSFGSDSDVFGPHGTERDPGSPPTPPLCQSLQAPGSRSQASGHAQINSDEESSVSETRC